MMMEYDVPLPFISMLKRILTYYTIIPKMKFGVNLEDKCVDFINGLFLILKHIIHKCKVLKTVPQFNVF